MGTGARAQAWALAGAHGACTGRAGGSSASARSAGGRTSGRRRGKARARAGSGTAGRAGAQAAGRQARARQGAAGLGARPCTAWALGARPGRLGWPWAVHSVHSAHFRSVLTRFFFLSHQMNTVHCKKKKKIPKKKNLLNSNKIK